MEKEIWKEIANFPDYEISSHGRVKSKQRLIIGSTGQIYNVKEKILTPFQDGRGYLCVKLVRERTSYQLKIHRLVASLFCEKPIGKDVVNHLNEIKTDNYYKNLEWVTPRENIEYSGRLHGIKNPIMKRLTNVYIVDQFSISGNFIKRWGSISDIRRAFGFSISSISKCCKGTQKTAHGFKWKLVRVAKYKSPLF